MTTNTRWKFTEEGQFLHAGPNEMIVGRVQGAWADAWDPPSSTYVRLPVAPQFWDRHAAIERHFIEKGVILPTVGPYEQNESNGVSVRRRLSDGLPVAIINTNGDWTVTLEADAQRGEADTMEDAKVIADQTLRKHGYVLAPQNWSVSKTNGPLNHLAAEVHATAVEHGWWEGGIQTRSLGDQFANFHCELSEAWEEYRDGHSLTEIRLEESSEGNGKPEEFPVELADVLIRVFDTAAAYGIDLDLAFAMKAAYNKTRPFRHNNKLA
jgi:NTP pyrophosphatase (non-canonical NTP hydrolase)